jgi:hypothetical protein
MFGRNKQIDATINTRVDHFEELKAAIISACSVAQAGGVSVAAIHALFQGYTEQYRQRSLFVADEARARAQAPSPEVAAANAARERRKERELQRERDEYRAAVTRAAIAEDERRRGTR